MSALDQNDKDNRRENQNAAQVCEYRAALTRIVDADDSKRAASASGQHSSITRWIPTEEAIQAARELLHAAK